MNKRENNTTHENPHDVDLHDYFLLILDLTSAVIVL